MATKRKRRRFVFKRTEEEQQMIETMSGEEDAAWVKEKDKNYFLLQSIKITEDNSLDIFHRIWLEQADEPATINKIVSVARILLHAKGGCIQLTCCICEIVFGNLWNAPPQRAS